MAFVTGDRFSQMGGMTEMDRSRWYFKTRRFFSIFVTHPARLIILDIMAGCALVHCWQIVFVGVFRR